VLERELTEGDLDVGWSEETREDWLTWLRGVRSEVAAGVKPAVNLDVALDHNGIHGLFDPVRTPLSWHVRQAADALYEWR